MREEMLEGLLERPLTMLQEDAAAEQRLVIKAQVVRRAQLADQTSPQLAQAATAQTRRTYPLKWYMDAEEMADTVAAAAEKLDKQAVSTKIHKLGQETVQEKAEKAALEDKVPPAQPSSITGGQCSHKRREIMFCNRIFSVSSPYPTEIMLGVWGEENVRTVTFDISPWVAAHGPGVLQIIANRPGETLETGEPLVYAVSDVSVDGGTATWTVTDVDTAIPGVGSCALVYMVGEDVVAKTPPYKTRIKDTLGHSGTSVPPALEAWYNDILRASATAQSAAERAQEAQAAIEGMTVSAHALKPGEPPTVEKTVAQGVVNLDFGLPGGTGGDKEFIYVQPTPSSIWQIVHNLAKFPSVTVVDSANSVVIGAVRYITENKVEITFSSAFSGKAYLN